MKRMISILILSIVIIASIQAQKYTGYQKLLDNTSWYTGLSWHHPPLRPLWYHTTGDTTINSKKYVVVKNNISFPANLWRIPNTIYLREDTIARKVFHLDSSFNEHLWYDFSLNIGDTMFFSSNTYVGIISKIDTISTIWGERRRLLTDTQNIVGLLEGVGFFGFKNDFLRFHHHYPNTGWAWQWSSCIYKDRVQAWVFDYENLSWGAQVSIPCQSMCPSIGAQDSLSGYDFAICPGQSITVGGPCDSTAYWTSLDSPSVVLDTGNFATFSPSINKKYLWHGLLKTDTFEIVVRTPIGVNIQGDSAACADTSSVLRATLSGSTPVNYTWSNGDSLNSISVNESGKYWVHVEDPEKCFADSDTLDYTAYDVPNVTVDSFKQMYLYDQAITLRSGQPTGGRYSGPGITNNVFNPFNAGIGTHVVKYGYANQFSCTDTALMIIEVYDYQGMQFVQIENQLNVFPNPSKGLFHLKFTVPIESGQLEVIEGSGKIVQSQLIQNTQQLDLDISSPSGIYTILIQTSNHTWIKRVVKL